MSKVKAKLESVKKDPTVGIKVIGEAKIEPMKINIDTMSIDAPPNLRWLVIKRPTFWRKGEKVLQYRYIGNDFWNDIPSVPTV